MSYQGTHNAMIANKERRYPGNNKRQGLRRKNEPTHLKIFDSVRDGLNAK